MRTARALPFWTPLFAGGLVCLPLAVPAEEHLLRPPAVPLIACDPYFSIWSCADRLTDAPTTHWTGHLHRLTSLVRVDGKTFRVMGNEPAELPALPQTAVEVLPTRTIYAFEGGGIHLRLTFTTPALPDDLELLARPATYIDWEARAADGGTHEVSVYFDNTSEPAVDDSAQEVVGSRGGDDAARVLRFGTKTQAVLQKKGDSRRIDWGHILTILPADQRAAAAFVDPSGRVAYARTGKISQDLDPSAPRPARESPVAAAVYDLGKVSGAPASCWIALAYDDVYGIQYFQENLRPYGCRGEGCEEALVRNSLRDHDSLKARCAAFDQELINDLRTAGGEGYARLGALCYRQCIAGNKLAADARGQPLLFPKENTSNGCIGTVDVIYPMAPLFLLFGPSLTKAMLVSNLDYASSPRWKWPFAPHDLGVYPRANGQAYGGGERTEENQMPVEESGNMLILLAALAKMEGHANFASRYWPVIVRWAEYLAEKGFDPENQLCTDDFMGHLAHNTNLSLKAILGLASFARLCAMRGDREAAEKYERMARGFAARWVVEADDGDHFRLAFDRKGTWSQKYNLVWDRILGLGLFPDAVRRKEMDFYRKAQKPFGLPLDNRGNGAKLDWTLWTATLTGDAADFEALLAPVLRYVNETPQRVAVGDFYDTSNGRHISMHSRPVVGGVFLKLLYDDAVWKKWAARDRAAAAGWAPIPRPPTYVSIVPTSEQEGLTWRHTTSKPPEGWQLPAFDASAWPEGPAGFGTAGTPGGVVRTRWNGPEIWLRREFTLPEGARSNLRLWMHHDEDAEVYINGVLAASADGFTTSYEEFPLSEAARAALRAGTNVIAIHCRQTRGGQYIDAGIVEARRE